MLEKYPEDGLKIFTEHLVEDEPLPRPKVLDYLMKTNKALVVPYLVNNVVYFLEDFYKHIFCIYFFF